MRRRYHITQPATRGDLAIFKDDLQDSVLTGEVRTVTRAGGVMTMRLADGRLFKPDEGDCEVYVVPASEIDVAACLQMAREHVGPMTLVEARNLYRQARRQVPA